ncbi:MAG TPA: hypothetical protein PKK26_01600 [Candidatus Wallbacteria bacterium]|nr:hypothetical protein [Candidatus Wallbacteria bacterium]
MGKNSGKLSKKFKANCFRIKGVSKVADVLILYLQVRSADDKFDNFMYIFDHGKMVFNSFADFQFSFNFNGRDYFLTKQLFHCGRRSEGSRKRFFVFGLMAVPFLLERSRAGIITFS